MFSLSIGRTGRNKANVYPQEVERCLSLHPNVGEAAVIGVPDDKWGDCVNAFVTYMQQLLDIELELMNHCKKYLGSYKTPKKIFILEELPRTVVGKIDKKKLQELAVELTFTAFYGAFLLY